MVKMSIVKLLQKIKFLWIVFGNNDNPYPPNWFKPEKSQFVREILWYIRNPFHNFFWYIVGFKDKNLDYTQIWSEKQKWNLILPFFSYRGKKWEFYIGWRPDSKAFGIALRKRKNANNT